MDPGNLMGPPEHKTNAIFFSIYCLEQQLFEHLCETHLKRTQTHSGEINGWSSTQTDVFLFKN